MDNRLVQNVSRILLLLSRGKASINTIIKQTGIYKNDVFEANNFLEKAEFAIRIKDKEIHQQKIFVQLTKFGQELGNFIQNTEEFSRSFDQLRKTIKNIYHISEGTEKSAIHSLLLNRGLDRQEINAYEEHFGYATDFELDLLSVLIEGIVNRYALFLLKFSPNKYAKGFLEQMIIRRLSNYLLIKAENTVKNEYIRCKYCGVDLPKQAIIEHRINEMVEENGIRLFDFFGDYVHIPFNNRHISDEVKDVINCLFSIIHLPKEYVEQKIKEEIRILDNVRTSKGNDEEIDATRNTDSKKKLLNYCAELNASA